MPGVPTGIKTSGLKSSFVVGVASTIVGIFVFGGLILVLKLEIHIMMSASLFLSTFSVEYLEGSYTG
jgi:hypothetical protein